MVYLGALAEGDHRVHALDAMTGEALWFAERPYPFTPEFTPTVAGDKVYVPGGFGEFHALDASTGKVVWSFNTGIPVESPPTVIGGIVYLTAFNTAQALDEATGALIWSYVTERLPARDFPAAVADNVYYFSPDEHIYALDTATGEILWSYEAGMMINTAPVTAGGIVYVGSESGRFYALDAATGGLVWSRESMAWALQSPMMADGVLYAESSDGHLRALDAATGEELWRFQKGYFDGIPSYTVIGDVMYVGSLDGSVYAFIAPLGTTTAEKVLTILYWRLQLCLDPTCSHEHHYQMTNRFAWSWKLTELGYPVILVYLGFLEATEMRKGREQNPLNSHAEWEGLVKAHSQPLFPEGVWDRQWVIHGQPFVPRICSMKTGYDGPVKGGGKVDHVGGSAG